MRWTSAPSPTIAQPHPGRAIGIVLAPILLAVACSASWNAPLSVAPEPGYPCGRTGVVCEALDGGASGMCCAEDEQCGNAGTSCPAGSCCFTGQDDGKLGAHHQHPQTPEVTK